MPVEETIRSAVMLRVVLRVVVKLLVHEGADPDPAKAAATTSSSLAPTVVEVVPVDWLLTVETPDWPPITWSKGLEVAAPEYSERIMCILEAVVPLQVMAPSVPAATL